MPVSERRLVQLAERYRNISRMTRWRIEREPDFPAPIVIRGRKYYDDAELTKWEELRRRKAPRATAATTEIATQT
jgi:hypothetical protein